MLIPTPLVQSILLVAALIAGQRGSVSANPVPGLYEEVPVKAGANAQCTYSDFATFNGKLMWFHVTMVGFGSPPDKPGQGLLQALRTLKRGRAWVLGWVGGYTGKSDTDSSVRFFLTPTVWTVRTVEGAIRDASNKTVSVKCTDGFH